MSDMASQQEVDKERQQVQNPIKQEFKPSSITKGFDLNREATESFTRKFNQQATRRATVEALTLRSAQDDQDKREINIRRNDLMQEVTRNINSGKWGEDKDSVEANIRAWFDTSSREKHVSGDYYISSAQLDSALTRGRALFPKTAGTLAYEKTLENMSAITGELSRLYEEDRDAAIEFLDNKTAEIQDTLLKAGASVSEVKSAVSLLEYEWKQEENEELDEKAQITQKIRKDILLKTLEDLGELYQNPATTGHDSRPEIALTKINKAIKEAREMGASEDDIKMLEASLGSQTGRYTDVANHNRQGRYIRHEVTVADKVSEWRAKITGAKNYLEALTIQAQIAEEKFNFISNIVKDAQYLSGDQRRALEQQLERGFDNNVNFHVQGMNRQETEERSIVVEARQDEAHQEQLKRTEYYNSPNQVKLRNQREKYALLTTAKSIEEIEEAERLEEQYAASEYAKQKTEEWKGIYSVVLPDVERFEKLNVNPSVGVTFATRATDIIVFAHDYIDNVLTKPSINDAGEEIPPAIKPDEAYRAKIHLTEMFDILEGNFESQLQLVQDSMLDAEGEFEEGAGRETLEQRVNSVWGKALSQTIEGLQSSYSESLSPNAFNFIKEELEAMKDPFDGRAIYFEGQVFANGQRITSEPNAQIITSSIEKNPAMWSTDGQWLGPGDPEDFEDLEILQYGNSYYEVKEDGYYEIDPESEDGKNVIALYTMSAEAEKDFFKGMLEQERHGEPIAFLLSDLSGKKNSDLLSNLMSVPLLSGERVSPDTPIPKSRWDRLVDSAYKEGTINDQESKVLNEIKGVLMAMSQTQQRNPNYATDERNIKTDIDSIMRVAIEMIYSKDVERQGTIPIQSGMGGTVAGFTRERSLPIDPKVEGIFEEARNIKDLRKIVSEMRLHYGRTTYDGRPVEDVTRTPISVVEEIEQATAAAQAAKGEEEAPPAEQVDSVTASRGMRIESTGFGAVAKEIETAEENSRFLVR